jgi:hypothetical protein
MSDAGVTPGPDPLQAVADAMEKAVEAARGGAAEAREAAARALPEAGGLLSKLAYNTCYAVSYGVVFPSVLAARSVPQNNAVVHGLIDGAQAALDLVDEMKRSRAVESHPTPAPPSPPSSSSESAASPDPTVTPSGPGGE